MSSDIEMTMADKENSMSPAKKMDADVLAKMDSADEAEVAWEYESKPGKWVRYEQSVSDRINAVGEDGLVELEMDDTAVTIDVVACKQANRVTGFRRNIRCAVRDEDGELSVWEYLKGRRYTSLPRDACVAIQKALREKSEEVSVVLEGVARLARPIEMTIEIDGKTIKLRHSISSAHSSMAAQPVPTATRSRTLTKRDALVDYKREVKEEPPEDDCEPKTKRGRGGKSAPGEEEQVEKKPRGGSGKKSTASAYRSGGKRTVIVKGRAPVDPECVEKVDTAHVYCEGDVVYDAMLNQTNIANNNNKFYILQVLQDDDQKRYSVWFRWGRVGYRGQDKLTPCGGDLAKAKEVFEQKFYDKTRNEWSERADFDACPGKYTLIKMDYATEGASTSGTKREEGEEQGEKDEEEEERPVPESKLDERVQRLMRLICDIRAMEETVLQMEYDSTRMPLGKLTQSALAEGYECLQRIETHIRENKFGKDFIATVNEYYTKIPHNFGFKQPPLIKTEEALKKETELLEMLADIEVAIRTLKKGEDAPVDGQNPIDRNYERMKCELRSLDKDDEGYEMVSRYLSNTHGKTHMYKMKLRTVYAVDKEGEKEQFKADLGNRKLLWHGSRLTNWYGILSAGLRIAPPEAPSTGYMFGKGVYFADVSSKSGNYCYPQRGRTGVMLLADVALGNSAELRAADYNADRLPKGKHSTFGLGSTGPDPKEDETTEDGVKVPLGKPVSLDGRKDCSLIYNEYVVYDTAQINIKYLVEVEFA